MYPCREMVRPGRHLPGKCGAREEYLCDHRADDLPDPARKIHGSQVTQRGLVDPALKPMERNGLVGRL